MRDRQRLGGSADPWELIDVRECARILGVCTKTVLSLMHRGDLSYVRVGRSYRTTRRAIARDLGLEVVDGWRTR